MLYKQYRLAMELNKLLTDIKSIKENEQRLIGVLKNERKDIDVKTKTLKKCEGVLQTVLEKNTELKQQNISFNIEVLANFSFSIPCYL